MSVGSVLVVGASVAGLGAANELRQCGFAGRIVLADAQAHPPYDRPPLSKGFLHPDATHAFFHEAEHYRERGIELRLGSPAASLEAAARRVTFADGSALAADAVVIATGARARRLPATVGSPGVRVVRDLDDAAGLRAEMRPGRRLLAIGGGFIGAEVVSTAVKLGLEATLVDAQPLPLSPVLGEAVARRILDLHAAAGVRLVLGAPVRRVLDAADGTHRVELADGRAMEADIVVAGLGAVPNVEWLGSSGLEIDDGVACDARGRTGAPGVFAAGDAAAWPLGAGGRRERHEHWTAAREQGRIVAQEIAGEVGAAWDEVVPYFWSDIHDRRIQLLGATAGADRIDFAFDDPAKGAFVAEFFRGPDLLGVAGCNAAGRVMRYSARLRNG